MPRNGDGSSDNGPIESHEIVHGTSGDKTLQHTKHVAPMPEIEAGDSLPGMGAGGVADVVQGDSEEFGTNEPKKDPLEDNDDDHNNADTTMTDRDSARDSSSRPTGPKRQKTGDVDVSGSQKKGSADATSSSQSNTKSAATTNTSKSSSSSSGAGNDLEQVSRHKAEKYVALDEDEVAMSSAGTEAEKREARADRRADALGEDKSSAKGSKDAEKYGGRADVEDLHGEADSRKAGGEGGGKQGSESKSDAEKSGSDGKGGSGGKGQGNELEQVQRHQAEKFGAVNLENE